MRSLLKWLVKRFINRDAVKAAVRAGNRRLAGREIGGSRIRFSEWGEDASATLSAYLGAFADDGRVDDAELERLNDRACAMVDKYLPDDGALDALVDALIK